MKRPTIAEKVKWLVTNKKIKIDIETGNVVYFTVEKSKDRKYDVCFMKFLDKWSCTCRHFSLKVTPCSHIKACQEFYNKR